MVGTAWLAVITLLFGYTEMGAFLVTLAIAFLLLFRSFTRRLPPKALGVVAPADGRVQSVEEGRDPFTGHAAWRIVIRQRALGEYNVHVPQEATVTQRFWPGKDTEGKSDPQLSGHLAFAFETDEEQSFSLAFGLRRWPRFIRIGAITGNRFGRGKRLGFAGFGLDVVLWVPSGTHVSARPGQQVLAGSDLLGSLPARQDAEPEVAKA